MLVANFAWDQRQHGKKENQRYWEMEFWFKHLDLAMPEVDGLFRYMSQYIPYFA